MVEFSNGIGRENVGRPAHFKQSFYLVIQVWGSKMKRFMQISDGIIREVTLIPATE